MNDHGWFALSSSCNNEPDSFYQIQNARFVWSINCTDDWVRKISDSQPNTDWESDQLLASIKMLENHCARWNASRFPEKYPLRRTKRTDRRKRVIARVSRWDPRESRRQEQACLYLARHVPPAILSILLLCIYKFAQIFPQTTVDCFTHTHTHTQRERGREKYKRNENG